MRAVGRIHVYQNNARQCAAELNNRPFGTICGPNSDAVAGTQSERPQTGRDALCLVRVFCPGEPDVLVAADEGDAIGKSIRSFKKGLPDRLSDDDTLWTLGITPRRR